MKKNLLFTCFCAVIAYVGLSQSIDDDFFTPVTYIGAFDGTNDWTAGWTEWDPVNKVYAATTSTKGNGLFSRSTSTHLTANETWSGVVLLDGWVYVDSNVTLTINAGTVIRGTAKSALIIEKGGKIMAEGTSTSPIVFTSNQGAGLRAQSDWAGVVICGRAPNNIAGGTGIAEGGIESPYGGNVPHDNSGIMKYVRIEFPGYEVATGKEINGLTLCSVGDGTTIDYVQVSYSGDDSYEWFGGTVNAKHIIAYKTEDDDFDTDNGFVGRVQFGISARDSSIVDTDAANAFESDNNEAGTLDAPLTHAIFSNISAFGPSASATSPTTLRPKHAEGSSFRIRRSSNLQIYNSVIAGYGRGIRVESENCYTAAQADNMTVQYTIVAGVRDNTKWFQTDATAGSDGIRNWFLAVSRHNDTITHNSMLKLSAPFNYTARNFQPLAGSPVLNASYWAVSTINLSVQGGGSAEITTDGGTLQLSAEVLPTHADDKSLSWAIEAGSVIASIDQNGLVTASSNNLGNGTITVKATANDGTGVYGTIDITISGQEGAAVFVTDINVTSSNGETTISAADQTLTLEAEVLPSNADVKTVSWSVSDDNLASITQSGVLTPISNGTVTVTASATDGSGITGTIDITIDLPTAINTSIVHNFVIYPNPVSNILNIINASEIQHINIYNITGQMLNSYNYNNASQIEIEVNYLKNGIYMIQLQTANKSVVQRFIKY